MNTYKKDTTDNIRSVLGFLKAMSKQASIISIWCGWWDLNPHGSPRHPLKMVRLPFRHNRIVVKNYRYRQKWCGREDLNLHGVAPTSS